MFRNNFPKNLALSAITKNGAYGKMVRFYDVRTEMMQSEKHPHDHEEVARKADASLLYHMVCDYTAAVIKIRSTNELQGKDSGTCLELLCRCKDALSPKGCSTEQFAGLQPYSKRIIATSCEYLAIALEVLDVRTMLQPDKELVRLYMQLCDLADQAKKRYEVMVYAD